MALKKDKDIHNNVSCGITWVHGGLLFKDNKIYAHFYYGICHWTYGVFFFTPEDYIKPTTGITTINVDPIEKYCSHAHQCINLHCKLNQFNMEVFLDQFKDIGRDSLGLPRDFGRNEEKKDDYNWFNVGKWKSVWKDFALPVTGGTLKYDRQKYYEKGD